VAKFVMLSTKRNVLPSCLMTYENWQAAIADNSPIVAIAPHVYREFEALCWCDAIRHWNKVRGHKPSRTSHCKSELDRGKLSCEFFFEVGV